MKRRIIYFLTTILLAIILSSPLSLTISLLSDYFSDPQAYNENYAYNSSFYILYTFIVAIIYIVVGIPTTLLADNLKYKKSFLSIFKTSYLIQVLVYTVSSLLFSYITLGFHFYFPAFVSWLTFAQVYFHVLLLIRLKRE
jgi:heme/copper-type cytochrome/quinol oxidase subunit 2